MNCLLSQLSSFTAAIVGRTTRFVVNSSLNGNPTSFSFAQKSQHFRIRSFRSELVLTRCYSTKKGRKSGSSRLQKVEPETTMEQEKEKDAFFVVRKGDVVGIYKTLTDSQAQVGSSVILFRTSYLLFVFILFTNCWSFSLFLNLYWLTRLKVSTSVCLDVNVEGLSKCHYASDYREHDFLLLVFKIWSFLFLIAET